MRLKDIFFANRSVKQTFFKNTFWLISSDVFAKAVAVVKNIIIARYLGAEGFGTLSFAIAFVSVFSVIPDLGFNILTVRDVARNKSKARKYIENVIPIKAFLSLITLSIIVISIFQVGKNFTAILLVIIIAFNLVIQSYSGFLNAIFRAFEKMEFEAFVHFINSISDLILTIIVVSYGLGIEMVAGTYIISSLISLITVCILMRKIITKFSFEVDIYFWKDLLKEAWPFSVSSVFVSIYFWVDTILLYIMKSNEIVGWYNAAYRLVFSLAFLPSLIMYSIYPYLSRAYHKNKYAFEKAYRLSLRLMAIIAIPLFVLLLVIAKPLTIFLYGSDYQNSIAPFQILLWAEFFAFFSHVFLFTLSASDKQKMYTLIVGISLLLNILLDIMLIPKHSYIGASVATLATEFMAFMMLVIYTEIRIIRKG